MTTLVKRFNFLAMKSQKAAEMAGALDGVSVKDHFGKDAFGANKRLFLTVSHEENTASIRLSPEEQRRALSKDGEAFAPVDNAWGRQGWTRVNLEFVDAKDFREFLISAFEHSKVKSAPTSTKAKKKVARRKR